MNPLNVAIKNKIKSLQASTKPIVPKKIPTKQNIVKVK